MVEEGDGSKLSYGEKESGGQQIGRVEGEEEEETGEKKKKRQNLNPNTVPTMLSKPVHHNVNSIGSPLGGLSIQRLFPRSKCLPPIRALPVGLGSPVSKIQWLPGSTPFACCLCPTSPHFLADLKPSPLS